MSRRTRTTRGGYVSQGWLVLLLALCFGAALAGVQAALSARIEENKRNETYDQIPSLVPGADAALTREVTLAGRTVYKAFAGGAEAPRHAGWVIKGSGQGFADRIELLIGLDVSAERITGMYVLEQKETPGLGNKIADDETWRKQFADKSASAPVTVTKASPKGNEIGAVTGATVSSESVCRIINTAIAGFRRDLASTSPGKD